MLFIRSVVKIVMLPMLDRQEECFKHVFPNIGITSDGTRQRRVITNHRVYHNHEFDWNKVEILDVERFYYKRIAEKELPR